MLTLLFDLDDTLLDSNMETFIPAYFQALSQHLAPYVSPDVMLPALVSGTRRMMDNNDPSHTLREVFDDEFYPKLEVEHFTLQDAIEDFYDRVFPSLASLTRPRPEAVQLVEWAFARGYRVAIATDPLFPLKATQHRLRFAGLPPEKYPFALVSSYETFHFTKAFSAYYAEFLGRLGWPDGPVLMVGNDAERDLAPAGALGLATFWINGGQETASGVEPMGSGSLSDLRRWLESVDLKSLEPQFKNRASILGLMNAVPASISSLIDEMPASAWTSRPAPAEWALTEVLCHLRDTEREVNQPRLQRLLTENEPFISARNTDAWAEERQFIRQNGRAAFAEFLNARLDTLRILNGLNEEDWARKARHSIFGPTTLQEMAGFMALHDRMHIQQIWKLIHPGL